MFSAARRAGHRVNRAHRRAGGVRSPCETRTASQCRGSRHRSGDPTRVAGLRPCLRRGGEVEWAILVHGPTRVRPRALAAVPQAAERKVRWIVRRRPGPVARSRPRVGPGAFPRWCPPSAHRPRRGALQAPGSQGLRRGGPHGARSDPPEPLSCSDAFRGWRTSSCAPCACVRLLPSLLLGRSGCRDPPYRQHGCHFEGVGCKHGASGPRAAGGGHGCPGSTRLIMKVYLIIMRQPRTRSVT
jgi:hypothetical protein